MKISARKTAALLLCLCLLLTGCRGKNSENSSSSSTSSSGETQESSEDAGKESSESSPASSETSSNASSQTSSEASSETSSEASSENSSGSSESSGKKVTFYFEETADGNAKLVTCTTDCSYVTIPDTDPYGRTVTTICEHTFQNSPVKEVTLPDTITTIESMAFEHCEALEEVHLNEGLTTIGIAFYDCEALKRIELPSTVTTLADPDLNFYLLCPALTEVYIPTAVATPDALTEFCAEAVNDLGISPAIKVQKGTDVSGANLYGLTVEEADGPVYTQMPDTDDDATILYKMQCFTYLSETGEEEYAAQDPIQMTIQVTEMYQHELLIYIVAYTSADITFNWNPYENAVVTQGSLVSAARRPTSLQLEKYAEDYPLCPDQVTKDAEGYGVLVFDPIDPNQPFSLTISGCTDSTGKTYEPFVYSLSKTNSSTEGDPAWSSEFLKYEEPQK